MPSPAPTFSSTTTTHQRANKLYCIASTKKTVHLPEQSIHQPLDQHTMINHPSLPSPSLSFLKKASTLLSYQKKELWKLGLSQELPEPLVTVRDLSAAYLSLSLHFYEIEYSTPISKHHAPFLLAAPELAEAWPTPYPRLPKEIPAFPVWSRYLRRLEYNIQALKYHLPPQPIAAGFS